VARIHAPPLAPPCPTLVVRVLPIPIPIPIPIRPLHAAGDTGPALAPRRRAHAPVPPWTADTAISHAGLTSPSAFEVSVLALVQYQVLVWWDEVKLNLMERTLFSVEPRADVTDWIALSQVRSPSKLRAVVARHTSFSFTSTRRLVLLLFPHPFRFGPAPPWMVCGCWASAVHTHTRMPSVTAYHSIAQ
jgi:hypothetical protein